MVAGGASPDLCGWWRSIGTMDEVTELERGAEQDFEGIRGDDVTELVVGVVAEGAAVRTGTREQFAGEGAVRGARAGSGGWGVRDAGGRRARGVQDAGRKEEDARRRASRRRGRGHSIAGGGVVRLVDALRPPLKISRDVHCSAYID
jgi:hypothetical protein